MLTSHLPGHAAWILSLVLPTNVSDFPGRREAIVTPSFSSRGPTSQVLAFYKAWHTSGIYLYSFFTLTHLCPALWVSLRSWFPCLLCPTQVTQQEGFPGGRRDLRSPGSREQDHDSPNPLSQQQRDSSFRSASPLGLPASSPLSCSLISLATALAHCLLDHCGHLQMLSCREQGKVEEF